MAADSRRLLFLTASEVDDLYGLPRFTEDDRLLYFDLSPAERKAVYGMHTTSAAVHLVLQLGYFKAKRRFFVYEHAAVLDGLQYILLRYFPERDLNTVKPLSKPTRLDQQEIVLDLFGYRLCDAAARAELSRMVRERDKEMDQIFETLRRSAALRCLMMMRSHALVTEEELRSLSAEVQRASESP
ncbi:DUF4158 domain-containing protein [Halochromatium sp.]